MKRYEKLQLMIEIFDKSIKNQELSADWATKMTVDADVEQVLTTIITGLREEIIKEKYEDGEFHYAYTKDKIWNVYDLAAMFQFAIMDKLISDMPEKITSQVQKILFDYNVFGKLTIRIDMKNQQLIATKKISFGGDWQDLRVPFTELVEFLNKKEKIVIK